MAEKTIIQLYPVLAFIAGAALKMWSIVLESNISPIKFAFISIFIFSSLMLIFILIFNKKNPAQF
jgi:hypothetical protein